MVVGRNGTAQAGERILRLGDLTSEKLPIELSIEGQKLTVEGYVYDTCPGSVKSAISRINKQHIDAMAKAEGDWQLQQIASREFMRYALLALIPDGLKPEDADLISGNEEKSLQILRFLGALPEADEVAEGDGEAEAAPPLTTEPSTLTSSPAMAPTTT